jgi:uncharacterized protein (DUF1697 family)
MRTYIALLHGINVGGHNMLKMAALKLYCEELGWQHVQTYIQSGNIIFRSDEKDTHQLADLLCKKLKEHLEKDISILIIELSELEEIYKKNPFIIERNIPIDKLYVTFLGDVLSNELIEIIQPELYKPDEFIIIAKAMYLYLPNGVADSKLAAYPFEKKFHTIATARNWKTVTKLVEMAKS